MREFTDLVGEIAKYMIDYREECKLTYTLGKTVNSSISLKSTLIIY
jgi:hypothetical protein